MIHLTSENRLDLYQRHIIRKTKECVVQRKNNYYYYEGTFMCKGRKKRIFISGVEKNVTQAVNHSLGINIARLVYCFLLIRTKQFTDNGLARADAGVTT